MHRPRFETLDELLDYGKGKGWKAIVAEFRDEYASFDLTKEPRNRRLAHPLSNYDGDLGVFYHFLNGTRIPNPSAREQSIVDRLRRVRAEEGGDLFNDEKKG